MYMTCMYIVCCIIHRMYMYVFYSIQCTCVYYTVYNVQVCTIQHTMFMYALTAHDVHVCTTQRTMYMYVLYTIQHRMHMYVIYSTQCTCMYYKAHNLPVCTISIFLQYLARLNIFLSLSISEEFFLDSTSILFTCISKVLSGNLLSSSTT